MVSLDVSIMYKPFLLKRIEFDFGEKLLGYNMKREIMISLSVTLEEVKIYLSLLQKECQNAVSDVYLDYHGLSSTF